MTDLTGAICENFNIKKCLELTKSQEKKSKQSNEIFDDISGLLDAVDELANVVLDEIKEEEKVEKKGEEEEEEVEVEDDLPPVVTDLESLWQYLLRLTKINALMNASSGSLQSDGNETLVDNGLLEGHAYSVLQAVEFEMGTKSKKTRLVKLRNPHGLGSGDGSSPWKGEWSVESKSWLGLDKRLKEKFQLGLVDHGEFYMSYESFYAFFIDLHVANTQIEALFNLDKTISSTSVNWKESNYFGEYKAGSITPETTDKLHQYLIKCYKKTHLIVSLMQPIDRNKIVDDFDFDSIGFLFGKVTCSQAIIDDKVSNGVKFEDNQYEGVENVVGLLGSREYSQRLNLEAGCYIFSPCYEVADATKGLKYLLRACYDANSTRILLLPKEK
jgi:small nuclear ribonucleoprotein (snRNP)-like protein